MKSKITIEYDFERNLPYILVKNIDEGDLRDKHVTHFRHSIPLEGDNLYIEFNKDPQEFEGNVPSSEPIKRSFKIYPKDPRK